MSGKPQAEHLKGIEDDQSVYGLNNIMTTIRSQLRRAWFASQALIPTMHVFNYNCNTARYEYAHGNDVVATNTTSAAAATLTCPANRLYRVKFVSSQDGTTGVSYNLTGNIGGTAVTFLVDASPVAIAEIQPIVGVSLFVDQAVTFHAGIPNPIELRAGDTLTVTAVGFIAADLRATVFIYEEIIVG